MAEEDHREAARTALKADIYEGLADIDSGRIKDFDPTSITERGRKLLAARNVIAAAGGKKV